MNVVNRVVFNMVTLYVKVIITMFISLYSVPLVLRALGASDFGLYNLIAGVIVMLAFLNASMTVSTQRFMSVNMGSSDIFKIKQVFNVSILLHLLIGVSVIIILELGSFFLFNGFLNINPDRISAAKSIYQFLVISTFFTILSVPFDAVINAHENMLAFSILEIFEALSKLILALILIKIESDKLVFYGACLALITITVMILKWYFCSRKYTICKIDFKAQFEFKLFKEMLFFTGWNTFGAVAMVGRNQGIAVILNLFFGTVVNAAYAIANQINGVLSNFSATLQKSINPQLMKSEGENNRERMLKIAFVSSKFSVLILCIFAIPLIVEMPYILKLWLGDFPDNTIWFCRLILIFSIVYQYSVGIMSSIQSAGNIRGYTLAMSFLLLLNLPASYLLLLNNFPAFFVLVFSIIIEIISLVVRMLFARRLVDLNFADFTKKVLFPTFIIIIASLLISKLSAIFFIESFLRMSFTVIISTLTIFISTWFIGLQKVEKLKLKGMYISLSNKLHIKIGRL